MEEFTFESNDDIYNAKSTGDNYLVSWETEWGEKRCLNYPKSVVEKYINGGWWIVIKE